MKTRKTFKSISIKLVFMLLLVSLAIIAAASGAAASTNATDEIKVLLDGKVLNFDVQPIIKDGRTLVPLRVIFESLGAKVEWNDKTRTVNGEKGYKKINLAIDRKYAYINGVIVELDVAPTIINNRTLVPLRFIAESLGTNVEWKGDTRTVIITSIVTDTPPSPEPTATPTQIIQPSPAATPVPPDTVGITSYNIKGQSGSRVFFQVYAFGLSDLGKLDFKISYDPSKVVAMSVNKGTIKTTDYISADLSSAWDGSVAVSSDDMSAISNRDGALFTIVFDILSDATGSTDVTLTPILRNRNGDIINVTSLTNGSITVKN